MIVFLALPFLAVGCIVYFVCMAIPAIRHFAMPTALWCIALVPGLFAWIFAMLMFALGREQWQAHADQLHLFHPPDWQTFNTSALPTIAIVILIATCLVTATVATIFHQLIIHRMTLALFRLYIALVTFGVGLLGLPFVSIGFLMAFRYSQTPWVVSILIGIIVVGGAMVTARFSYRQASQFRGGYPSHFAIVSREEFYTATGSAISSSVSSPFRAANRQEASGE